MKKYFNPDLPTGSGGKLPKKTAGTPIKDADTGDVSETIVNEWAANPDITLKWITHSEFSSAVTNYNSTLSDRLLTGSERPSQTSDLVTLDRLSKEGTKEVKTYIQKKFKTTGAEVQYARYGFVKESNGHFTLPRDRNKRVEALKLTVASIAKDGFSDEEYGTAFWTDMIHGYVMGMKTANATDSAVSTKVSSKNELKKLINKTMACLRLAIRANYPDTYKAEFRKWGWQKEDY